MSGRERAYAALGARTPFLSLSLKIMTRLAAPTQRRRPPPLAPYVASSFLDAIYAFCAQRPHTHDRALTRM